MAVALRAGGRSARGWLQPHNQYTSANTRLYTMVTCSSEMIMRWLTGACEYLPLLTRNGALLAYRQRNQNTGICAIG